MVANLFSSSEVSVINGKTLSATVVSGQQLTILLTTSVISGPGAVNVSVLTPSGNSGDLGCTSGGKSSVLVLTVNSGGASEPFVTCHVEKVCSLLNLDAKLLGVARRVIGNPEDGQSQLILVHFRTGLARFSA